MNDRDYWRGAYIVGGLVFAAGWIYAIATFGLFLGVGLGWIPALVIGGLAGVLWPILAGLLALGVFAVIVIYLIAARMGQ